MYKVSNSDFGESFFPGVRGGGGIKGTIVYILSYLFIIFYIIFIFFFFVFCLTFYSFKLIITPKILILINIKVIFDTYITHTFFCDM